MYPSDWSGDLLERAWLQIKLCKRNSIANVSVVISL